jgi:hypothetical protein
LGLQGDALFPPERNCIRGTSGSTLVFNRHYDCDGAIIFKHACSLGCEGIVSKRVGSPYRSGRVSDWIKIKNPAAPAVKREAEEDWGGKRKGASKALRIL